ncbi:hypothetical protein A2U01_0066183 [Trifolium medium]|uniref:Uncharacterized protein n=1 Tax=Trifolium medium TaxID=97028 RepID=A0A392S9S9_9FABA|nr:hypothetical protein [Trifolium medium]
MLKLTNPFLEEIKEYQKRDHKLMEKLVLINEGKETDFGVDGNGVMRASKWIEYSSRGNQDVPRPEEVILVAWYEEANF